MSRRREAVGIYAFMFYFHSGVYLRVGYWEDTWLFGNNFQSYVGNDLLIIRAHIDKNEYLQADGSLGTGRHGK
jgi:hypothetical protein